MAAAFDFTGTDDFSVLSVHLTPVLAAFAPDIAGVAFSDFRHELIHFGSIFWMSRHGNL